MDLTNFRELPFCDKYLCSQQGEIYSKRTKQLLSPYTCKTGYQSVCLTLENKVKNMRVNRIIALTWIPIPDRLKDIPIEQLQVNHKNENKIDNRVENLEWMTAKENTNYGTGIQRRAEKQRGKKMPLSAIEKLGKKVGQFDKDMNLIATFPSTGNASKVLGFTQGHIAECCRGERNKHKGYIWKYIDNEKKEQ